MIRRLLPLLGLLVLLGCTRIEPGHVGIKISYAGTYRGAEEVPTVQGYVFYLPWASAVLSYPIFVQNVVWTHSANEGRPQNEEITFTTGDQMQVAVDIALAYELIPAQVPHFYMKFRSDDLSTFTHGFLRNLARDKFDATGGRYRVEDIMGDNAKFLKEVRDALQGELNPIGVHIVQFGLIGAPRPPPGVIAAINAKVTATQDAIRVENELRQSKAQAQKVIAEAQGDAQAKIARAEGDAKANAILAQSITESLIKWRNLDLMQQALARWDGKRPMVEGTGSGLLLSLTPEMGGHK